MSVGPNIKDMVYNYLAGLCNEEESRLVEDWLKDDANKKLFDQMAARMERLGKFRGDAAEVDVDAAWKKVSGKLNLGKDKVRIIPLYARIPTALRIAASVIVILGLIYFFRANQPSSGPQYALDSTSTDAPMQLAESGSENLEVDLADQTKITLRKNSKVRYPSSYSDTIRLVALDEGEAFFKVKRDESKPFIVETPSTYIEVLGTSFNIEIIDSNEIEVSVTEGLVRVYGGKDRTEGQAYIDLKKGERCRRNANGLFRLEKISLNSISWLTGNLRFNNQSLLEVFKDLEHHYNVKFKVDNEAIYDCRLTAKFKKQELKAILENLQKTFDLKFKEEEGEVITVVGKGC